MRSAITAKKTDFATKRAAGSRSKDDSADFLRLSALVCILIVLLGLGGCATRKKIITPMPEAVDKPDSASQRIAQWHVLMQEKQAVSIREKLESVNSFFNKLNFVDDYHLWGRDDYWATPLEMLRQNGGDCEDFATAKYFTLRELAVPDDEMRLTYVKSLKMNRPHMVLTYYSDSAADPLVLDSLVDVIAPASKRPDLVPVYSFNGQGLWLARRRSSEQIGGADRLSLWQELQYRWSREAFAGTSRYVPLSAPR